MLSLLACVLTGWWWSGSNSRMDELTYERHGVQTVQLKGSSGKVMLSRTAFNVGESGNLRQVTFNSSPLDPKGASEMQNVSSIEPGRFSRTCEVNTTGWMKLRESRIARNEMGISTTPKSA